MRSFYFSREQRKQRMLLNERVETTTYIPHSISSVCRFGGKCSERGSRRQLTFGEVKTIIIRSPEVVIAEGKLEWLGVFLTPYVAGAGPGRLEIPFRG